jgi:hypothetical protein
VELMVNNLGRVKQARIDVRPLTVFIGPNHTNKTWTAYALYGIARNLARVAFSARRTEVDEHDFVFGPSAELQSRVEKTGEEIFRAITSTPAGETKTAISRADILDGVDVSALNFSLDSRGLGLILGVPPVMLVGASAQLTLTEEEFNASGYSNAEISCNPSSGSVMSRFFTKKPSTRPDSFRYRFGSRRNKKRAAPLFETDLKDYLVEAVGLLTFTCLADAAVLPAERTALMSLQTLDIDLFTDEDVNAPKLAAPVYDFVNMIDATRARLRGAQESNKETHRSLARALELDVLQGSVKLRDGERGEGRPDLHSGFSHVAHEGFELALHASASIVRSLAGLDIYLKHFAGRGGLVVIDEPEMNAHPEAQLKIIEFLAVLAQSGVRVVLTTHSPYIVDHLSNLMQASRLGEEGRKSIAPQFKLRMSEAFLSPDDVSVYLFNESGDVSDILDRDQGIIDLASFSNPTEYMANLVNAIWKAAEHGVDEIVEEANAI